MRFLTIIVCISFCENKKWRSFETMMVGKSVNFVLLSNYTHKIDDECVFVTPFLSAASLQICVQHQFNNGFTNDCFTFLLWLFFSKKSLLQVRVLAHTFFVVVLIMSAISRKLHTHTLIRFLFIVNLFAVHGLACVFVCVTLGSGSGIFFLYNFFLSLFSVLEDLVYFERPNRSSDLCWFCLSINATPREPRKTNNINQFSVHSCRLAVYFFYSDDVYMFFFHCSYQFSRHIR